jgi:hypothetical protein
MVNNMNNNYSVKRYNYGVIIDLLPDICSRRIRERVTNVRDQARQYNYLPLDDAAMQQFEARCSQQAIYGVRAGSKAASLSGQKFHLLCASQGLLVLTYRFDKVNWEVTTALSHGTPVCIYKPYANPDMVQPKSVAEWVDICEREANPDWSKWLDELDINLQFILNTPTPWLEYATLKEFANQFDNFRTFLDLLQSMTAAINSKGEWDVDASQSVVYNEKASVAHYVANTGMDKGKRTASCAYKYGHKQFWYNYEVLPADIMVEFLHLSYLDSINYKPLQRIATASDEDYGRQIFTEYVESEDADVELGLTLTPLYEDPYFDHETMDQMFR